MKALKKPLSLFLAFLMCFGVFAGTGVTAFAAGETMTTYMVDIPRASDPNKAGWGHSDMSFLGGWSAQANDIFSVHTQDAYNGKAIYCIEPGIGVKTGDQYTGRGEDFWDNYPSHLNPTIPPSTIKEYIGRIMTYGWQGNADTSWNSNNPDDANEMAGYIATQLLVWETVVGERDSQFNHVDANAQGKNNVAEYISSSHPLRSQIFSQYSAIESAVKRHTMLPSFFSGSPDARAYELKWDGEKYSVTLFSTVTESNGVYQPVYDVTGLSGAVFEITALEDVYTLDGTLRYSAGEVVDTITTGEDGTAQSQPLYLGKFQVKEIEFPHGMVDTGENVTNVELVYAGQEVEITETSASFYNQRQKAQVTLNKLLEQDEAFGIGVNGEISAVTFGLYAQQDIPAADGSVIPADGLLEIVSVAENGQAVCATDLPFGSFYLKELSTDSHYLLNGETFPFTFEYGGPSVAVVEITANDGEAITNELIRGEIHGLKTDENGAGLGGAVIGLFKSDESEFTAENTIATATSADDGSFSFTDVPYGNWVLKELESPEGFVLSDEVISVTIEEDGQVVEISFANERVYGDLRLTKVDKDYPDNKNLSMCLAMSTAPRPMTACGFPTASGAGSLVGSADTAPWTILSRSMAIRLWTQWKPSPAGRQSGRLLLCLRLKRKNPSICFCRRPRRITGLWWTTSKKEGSTKR